MQLGFGEQGLEIGFVRGAGDHRDLLALERFRAHVVDRIVAPRDTKRAGVR